MAATYRETLLWRLEQVQSEIGRLSRALDDIIVKRDQLVEEQRHLEALLGGADVGSQAKADRTPQERIADLVVKLLSETGPLHYRDIAAQLHARGWISGRAELNAGALLARYYKDSRLHRPARGVYQIRTNKGARSAGQRRRRRTG